MLVRITQSPAPVIDARRSVREAADALVRSGAGALLVQDEGRLVGVLSERDLLGRVVREGADPDSVTVEDVMRREVVSMPPAAAPADVFETMRAAQREAARAYKFPDTRFRRVSAPPAAEASLA